MDKIKSDTPKKQHYVPQFLLKNFSYGKKNKIFAFDKARTISFGTSVIDSACENGFYNLKINNQTHTLEYKLSKLESICGDVIKRICRDESLEGITAVDCKVLCVFVTNMLLRVKKQREFLWQVNTGLAEWLQSMGLDPNEVNNFNYLEKEEINEQHIHFTNENLLEFAQIFYEKPIALLKAPNGANFIISDNPVVMHNYWPREGRGNNGISVPGVVIQIPLSRKLCLSFVCPLLLSDLNEKLNSAAIYKARGLPIGNIDLSHAEAIISSINERKAIEITTENVEFSNYLQIVNSLKYIYSDKNDFRLAEEVIKENSDLANGKVVKMGW